MTLKDFETFKENPTIKEGIIMREYLVKANEVPMVNTETGEYGVFKKIDSTKQLAHDTLQYTKVYNNSLSSIKDFSNPALKVWVYILANLTPRKEDITINMKECMEYTGYLNIPNVYKGIIELLEKNFIFRKTGNDNTYFINSNYFFNGKRI